MLKYKTRDQKSLYFETYIAQIQLDELSHVDQEVFIYQNQESDLFCAQLIFSVSAPWLWLLLVRAEFWFF